MLCAKNCCSCYPGLYPNRLILSFFRVSHRDDAEEGLKEEVSPGKGEYPSPEAGSPGISKALASAEADARSDSNQARNSQAAEQLVSDAGLAANEVLEATAHANEMQSEKKEASEEPKSKALQKKRAGKRKKGEGGLTFDQIQVDEW